MAALADALTLGCPQGYVRVFTDEGPPMAALLGRLIAAQKAGQGAARDIPLSQTDVPALLPVATRRPRPGAEDSTADGTFG